MTDIRTRLFGSCAALSVAAVLLYGGAAGAATPLSVCIDVGSPSAGVTQQVAEKVAANAGRKLQVYKFDSSKGDAGYIAGNFRKLADKHCELVMGFPLDTDAKKVRLPGLHMTVPYAHTGFVLVTPKASKATKLEQLPKGSLVGVTYLTTPNIYFRNYPELQADVELNTQASVNALVGGKVKAAMLWRPAVLANLSERGLRDKYTLHTLHKPHSTYDVMALYATKNKKSTAAAKVFNTQIAAMEKSGELKKILGETAEAGPMPGANKHIRVIESEYQGVIQRGDAFAAGGGEKTSHESTSSAGTATKSGKKPALYTAAQAKAGKLTFAKNCARCHGARLLGFKAGGRGPALVGKHFAPASSGLHVKDIFSIVSNNMPADQPGTLTHKQYLDIMTFLLKKNGYPAGDKALTFGEATRSTVPFVSK